MTKVGEIRNVLTDPDRFFSELSERETNLTIPAGIVLIVAILVAIYAVVVIGALPATSLLGLWSAYIWIFGIKHARNISTRGALITIGVPVGISIVCYMNYVYGITII